jgi:hypothetical protein
VRNIQEAISQDSGIQVLKIRRADIPHHIYGGLVTTVSFNNGLLYMVKVRVVPVLKHQAMKTYWGLEV